MQLRRELCETIEEMRWIAVIFEESANAAVLLDNSRRILLREFRDQIVFAVGRRMEEKGEQTISLQPSCRLRDVRIPMPQTLITSDPKIMMGKPTLTGTRITVELILEKLAAGETVDQILSEHPRLTAEGIRAALAFAADVLRADVVYPVEKITR